MEPETAPTQPTIDDVIVALACSDDYELDQAYIARNTRGMLDRLKRGELSHNGDCTKQSHTCLLCLCHEYQARAKAFMATLG